MSAAGFTSLDVLPAVEVTLDDVPAGEAFLSAIVDVTVEQRVNAAASCQIMLSDPDGAFAARLVPGPSLTMHVGPDHALLFAGSVATVAYLQRGGHERTLRIIAYDPLERLRRGAAVRVHSDVAFGDLVRDLAKRASIEADPGIEGRAVPRVVQHRRSDLEVLTAAAEREGLYIVFRNGKLRTCAIAPAHAEAVERTDGAGLREFSVTLSDCDDVPIVDVRGWDPRSSNPVRGRGIGSAGARTEVVLTNIIAQSDAQADALGESQASRRAVARAVLSAVVDGDPAIGAGECVRLGGVDAAFAGPFRITRARHVLTSDLGYVVEISSGLPPPHKPEQVAMATLGVVADTRDPQHFGRIKVTYPALADAESDWLQVVAAGAGGKKGMLAIPQTGDRVVVLGFDDDPAHGVVLGALYGDHVHETFSGYALYSPGGHAIELDDSGTLRVRAANGAVLAFGPDLALMHAETDIRIEAPGKTVTIAAAHVELRTA